MVRVDYFIILNFLLNIIFLRLIFWVSEKKNFKIFIFFYYFVKGFLFIIFFSLRFLFIYFLFINFYWFLHSSFSFLYLFFLFILYFYFFRLPFSFFLFSHLNTSYWSILLPYSYSLSVSFLINFIFTDQIFIRLGTAWHMVIVEGFLWPTFGLIGFYGISTLLDYSMPNPLYIRYMGFAWFGFLAHQLF